MILTVKVTYVDGTMDLKECHDLSEIPLDNVVSIRVIRKMKLIILMLIATTTLHAQRIPTDRTINEEGRRIYLGSCVRCHNINPSKPGTIGPELITTPLEVFKVKVPKGDYPPNYTPKRRTKVMPKFPSLADKVDFIYNYIQSTKNERGSK